jgi:cytochrome b561
MACNAGACNHNNTNSESSAQPDTMEKFSFTTRLLHWAIAAFLLVQIPLAWYMTDLPLGPDMFAKYALHKSLGMVLFTLAVARLIWAIIGKRPALPPQTKRYEKILAKATQGLLYLLVIVMPFSGWAMSSAANVPVKVFGVIALPNLVAPNEQFMENMQNVHELQSIVLLSLITLHLLAGLKHYFVDRDNVLQSMLPLIKKK